MSLFSTRHEVEGLKRTIDELRAALEASWRRRQALEADVAALQTQVEQLREAAATAPQPLDVDRQTLRRQIDDLLAVKARLVDQLGAAGGQLAGALGRVTAAGDEGSLGATGGRVYGDIARAGRMFVGRVQVEVDPLEDFGAIAAFEHALARVPEAADAHVRRLEGSRAVLELELREPTQLLRALDGTLPFDVDVASTAGDHLSFTVRAKQGVA